MKLARTLLANQYLWLGLLGTILAALIFITGKWTLNYQRRKHRERLLANQRQLIEERLLEERKLRRDSILIRPISDQQDAPPPAAAALSAPAVNGVAASTSAFIMQAEQSISREKLKDPNSYNLYDPSGVYDLHGDTIAGAPSLEFEETTFFPSSMRKSISNYNSKYRRCFLNCHLLLICESPADDDEEELRTLGDWNQRFQNAIQTIRSMLCTSSCMFLCFNFLSSSLIERCICLCIFFL